jgi:CheY-like chemotaxis protein
VARILAASDAPSIRRDVSSVLTNDDQLVEVTSGREVGPAVDGHEPELVVLDMQIGNMGAMATCLDLRLEESAGRLPHVGVLMLLDRRADVHLARRSDADGWVVKPLDPIRLRRAVQEILAGGIYEDDSYKPVPV